MTSIRMTILLLAVVPALARPADLASLAEARAVADRAVALFRDEKFVEGYGELKPYWPLAPVEIDGLVNQTVTQWPIVRQRFGTSITTEFVQEMQVGVSFVQYVYLQKFENHAIRWLFTFYKPRERWVVNGVSFDDSIELLFTPQ